MTNVQRTPLRELNSTQSFNGSLPHSNNMTKTIVGVHKNVRDHMDEFGIGNGARGTGLPNPPLLSSCVSSNTTLKIVPTVSTPSTPTSTFSLHRCDIYMILINVYTIP
jgi:hypothetical protein